MPSYLRGQKRDVFRFAAINPVFFYGFQTKSEWGAGNGNLLTEMETELGHEHLEAFAGMPNIIRVSGANSPKPPRYSKRTGGTSTAAVVAVSSYCAFDFEDDARLAGWRLSKPGQGTRLSNWSGSRTQTAIAELSNGLLYAFPMNRTDFSAVGAELGLQSASTISDTERKKIAFGCATKPGKVEKRSDNGRFSTYYSTAQQTTLEASNDWKIISTERIEFPPI